MTSRKNPYVGPRSFERADRGYFFGREQEAKDLLSLVRSNRLVLFHAQSGAGKTSVLRASLIPALEEADFLVLPIGRVAGSADDPYAAQADNVYVYNLLTHINGLAPDPKPEVAASTTLSTYLKAYGGLDESPSDPEEYDVLPQILIIDQFEEIFTTNQDKWPKRAGFFRQLAQAMEEDPALWVLLCMRDDYIARLDPFVSLLPGRLRIRIPMQRMERNAAIRAISLPAASQDIEFTSEAVDALVTNLLQIHTKVDGVVTVHPGQFVEPMQLQVVCYQLWRLLQNDEDGKITAEELQAIADGNLSTFVSNALRLFYEEKLAEVLLDPHLNTTPRALRSWFSNELITPDETRSLVYQGEETTGSLDNQIIQALEQRFLVRAESRSGGIWYELVHDRFVPPVLQANRQWREEQLRQDPIAQDAANWRRADRPVQNLYEGRQLQEALTTVGDLSQADPDVKAYLEAADDAHQKREMTKQRKEMKEQKALTENARRHAEKTDRANRQLATQATQLQGQTVQLQTQRTELQEQTETLQHRGARLRLQRLFLVGFALLAIGALGFALNSWKVADDATDTAQANQATAQANQAVAETAVMNEASARQTEEAEKQKALDAVATAVALRLQLEGSNLRESTDALIEAAWESQDMQAAVLFSRRAVSTSMELPGDEQTLRFRANDALVNALSPLGDVYETTGYELDGAAGPAFSLAYSPDGSLLAAGYEDGTVILWNAFTGEEVRRLFGHSGRVFSLTFIPDGQELISGSGDGQAILWNTTSGEIVRRYAGHTQGIVDVAVDHAGERLATAGFDGIGIVWNLASGEQVATLRGHSDGLQDVEFTTDGTQVLTASVDGTANVYDAATGALLGTLQGHNEPLTHIAVSPDGRLWATASDDGSVKLWDSETMEEIRTCCRHEDWIYGIAFSPSGSQLATASKDETVGLWDTASGERLALFDEHDQHVWEVAFSPDGEALASVSSDGLVLVRPLIYPLRVKSPLPAGLNEVQYSGDGASAAAYTQERALSYWAQAPLQHQWTITPTIGLHLFTLNSDGSHLATLARDGKVAITSVTTPLTPTVSFTVPTANLASGNTSVQFSHNEKGEEILLVANPKWDQPVQIMPLKAKGEKKGLSWSQQDEAAIDAIEKLYIGQRTEDAQGRFFVSRNITGTVRIWDSKLENSHALDGVPDSIDSIRLSRDGRYLILVEQKDGESAFDRVFVVRSDEGSSRILVDTAVNGHIRATDVLTQDGRGWLAVAAESDGASQIELFDLASKGRNRLSYPYDGRTIRQLEVLSGASFRVLDSERWSWDYAIKLDVDLLDVTCGFVRRNLSFTEWTAVRRDIPHANDARICSHYPIHQSILMEHLRNPDDLPLDLVRAGIEEPDVVNALIQLGTDADATQMGKEEKKKAFDVLMRAADIVEDTLAVGIPAPWTSPAAEKLSRSFADLCGQSLPQACDEASAWAVEVGTVQLMSQACEAAAQRGFPDAGRPACERAVETARENSDIDGNLDLCELAETHESITGWLSDACDQAIELVQMNTQPFRGQQICARSLESQLPADVTSGVCQRAVALAGAAAADQGELDQGELDHSVQLCQLDFPGALEHLATAACGQLTAHASPLEAGIMVSGTVEPSVPAFWAYPAEPGDLVTIALLENEEQVSYSLLEAMGLRPVTSIDGPIRMEKGGLYLVSVQTDRSEDVDYQLVVYHEPEEPLALDTPQVDAFGGRVRWQFNGVAGDVLSVHLESVEGLLPDDTGLQLVDSSFDLQATVQAQEGVTTLSLENILLTKDDTYTVQAVSSQTDATYRLLRTTGAPELLSVGDAVTVSNQTAGNQHLWLFRARQGEAVRITKVTTASADVSTPQLFSSDGKLLSPLSSSSRMNEQIVDFLIGSDGQYYVRGADGDDAHAYSIRFDRLEIPTLALDETETATVGEHSLWRIDSDADRLLRISLESEGGDFDPFLKLLDGEGHELKSDDDGGDGLNSLLTGVFVNEGDTYYIRVGPSVSEAAYRITVSEDEVFTTTVSSTEHASTAEKSWYRFEGEAGDVVDFVLSGASPEYDPMLRLYDGAGDLLESNDDSGEGWSGYDSAIRNYPLGETRSYYLWVGRADSSEPYTLTLSPVQPAQVQIGTPLASSVSQVWLLEPDRTQTLYIHPTNADESTGFSLFGENSRFLQDVESALLMATEGDAYTLFLQAKSERATLQVDVVEGDLMPLALAVPVTRTWDGMNRHLWELADLSPGGIAITATVDGEAPHLALYNLSGKLLPQYTQTSDEPGPESVLQASVPVTGTHYLLVDAGGPAEIYTLQVDQLDLLMANQQCGLDGTDSDFAPIVFGSRVILGKHRPVNGNLNWSEGNMDRYVGQEATVTRLSGADSQGCPIAQVDIDDEEWKWRIRDMQIVHR